MELKDSFRTTFHRCLLTDLQGNQDHDFIRLARQQSFLTFNLAYLNPKNRFHWFETPFREIRFTTLEERIRPEFKHLLKEQKQTKQTIEQHTGKLVEGIKQYLTENLKPDQKYLFLHSGGYDSRIISACMKDLWDEGMRFDIHFRCHQPEGLMFNEIMKREGWPKSMYSVYPGRDDNYYQIGYLERPLNGWHNYNQSMNFWNDIINDEREYTLITGLGGELFKYIAIHSNDPRPKRCENDLINILLQFNPDEGQWDGLYMKNFKDLLMPLFGYPYLTHSLTVNPRWCKFNGQTDSVRIETTKRFKYKITDIPYGKHDYSWNLSDVFFRNMDRKFRSSLFYKTYGKYLKHEPNFRRLYGWDAQIWGFMTAYDKIYE